MKERIYVTDWQTEGDLVRLEYSDGSIVYVTKEKFTRLTGPIVSVDKADVVRDFGITFPYRSEDRHAYLAFVEYFGIEEEHEIYDNGPLSAFADEMGHSFGELIDKDNDAYILGKITEHKQKWDQQIHKYPVIEQHEAWQDAVEAIVEPLRTVS